MKIKVHNNLHNECALICTISTWSRRPDPYYMTIILREMPKKLPKILTKNQNKTF